jgi:diguanylate cyclase (GGDEF)-like protein
MNLSRSSAGRIDLRTPAIGGLAVLAGLAATVRLDSDQAQNLWLVALCLLLAPSLASNRTRQLVAVGGVLAAAGLAITSTAYGADSTWTIPLVLFLLSASLAVQMQSLDFTGLIPGSAVSLLILIALASRPDRLEVEPAIGLAGGILAALAFSAAFVTIERGSVEILVPAACLALAGTTAIAASLDASRLWVTCSVLLVGTSLSIRTLSHTDQRTGCAGLLPLDARIAVASAVGLGAGSALLVSASSGNPDLQWPMVAIVGSGIFGLGCVALHARAAFGEQVRQFERARLESRIDELTGLANRRAIQARLQDEIARSIRYDHPLSVLMIDLDDFKSVNDRFGHAAGDAALTTTAHAIETSIRSIDLAGRYGGEEFLVILPETATPGAEVVAERIRSSIENGVRVTVSIGLATLAPEDSDPSNLVDRADAALYDAKRTGKNRVVLFS